MTLQGLKAWTGPDFCDRLREEGLSGFGYQRARALRDAGIRTEEDWLSGEWRLYAYGIGPGLEAAINAHIGKKARKWAPTRPDPADVYTYVLDARSMRIFHYTAHRLVWVRRTYRQSPWFENVDVLGALCGQTPAFGEYTNDVPADRKLCGLCSATIDRAR